MVRILRKGKGSLCLVFSCPTCNSLLTEKRENLREMKDNLSDEYDHYGFYCPICEQHELILISKKQNETFEIDEGFIDLLFLSNKKTVYLDPDWLRWDDDKPEGHDGKWEICYETLNTRYMTIFRDLYYNPEYNSWTKSDPEEEYPHLRYKKITSWTPEGFNLYYPHEHIDEEECLENFPFKMPE